MRTYECVNGNLNRRVRARAPLRAAYRIVLNPNAKFVLMTQQNGAVFEPNPKAKVVLRTQHNGTALESSSTRRGQTGK